MSFESSESKIGKHSIAVLLKGKSVSISNNNPRSKKPIIVAIMSDWNYKGRICIRPEQKEKILIQNKARMIIYREDQVFCEGKILVSVGIVLVRLDKNILCCYNANRFEKYINTKGLW